MEERKRDTQETKAVQEAQEVSQGKPAEGEDRVLKVGMQAFGRRFREYEAFVSMAYEVPVITTVVCSADMQQVRSSIEQGINTYKVEVVQH